MTYQSKVRKLIAIVLALVVAFITVIGTVAAVSPDAAVERTNLQSVGYPLTLYSGAGITQSVNGDVYALKDYSTIDLQYVIQMSGTNTTTLTLMANNYARSISSSYWVTVTGTFTPAADGSTIGTFPLLGRWTYLRVGLANTNPVTVSVVGVAK